MIHSHVLFCLFGFLASILLGAGAREAIVNGDKAEVDQFPYQVSLRPRGNHYCGGGIIGERHILTAAHCVINNDNEFYGTRLPVLAGTNDVNKTDLPAMIINVQRIYVPAEYNSSGLPYGDIAVLRLKRRLKLSDHIKKLDLPHRQNEVHIGTSAKIAGFGYHWIKEENDTKRGGTFDNQLRFTDVNVIDHCMLQGMKIQMATNLICAKAIQHNVFKPRGTCHGDSGGPLVDGNTVIGILSRGSKDCRESVHNSIYINVSHYLDFIQKAIQDKREKDIRVFPDTI